ncbi:MAG: hypothetical protein DRH57_00005, partial [Candidatus Cloacimonadota bacterium]
EKREEDILKWLDDNTESLPEDSFHPELIPDYTPIPSKPVLKRKPERVSMFSFGVDSDLSLKKKIESAYSIFQNDWREFLQARKERLSLAWKAVSKGIISPEEVDKFDFVVSALEWVKGTDFKHLIKRGLVNEKEARVRIKFFETYAQRVWNAIGERLTGLDNVLKSWARGELNSIDPKDTIHIRGLIEDALSDYPAYTLQQLIELRRAHRIEIIRRLSKSYAYTLLDRFIEKGRKIDKSSLDAIYKQLRKYVIGSYVLAIEGNERSPLLKELMGAGLSKQQAIQLVKNSSARATLFYLDYFWSNYVKESMGFYRLDTPLGWAGGLFKWTWDLIKLDFNALPAKSKRLLVGELEDNILPTIDKFIEFGDKLLSIRKTLELPEYKHISAIRALMKKLRDTIDAYLNKSLDVKKAQRELEHIWNVIVDKYAVGNHRVLAKLVARELFLTNARIGLHRKDVSDFERYKYQSDGFLRFLKRYNDAYSALLYLAKNGEGATKIVAEHLLKLPYTSIVLPHVPIRFVENLFGGKTTGLYRPYEGNMFGEIIVDPNALPDIFEATIFHEILHALTLHTLHFSKKREEYRERINSIINDIRPLISEEEYKLGKWIVENEARLTKHELKEKIDKTIAKDSLLQEHVARYGKQSWLSFLVSLHDPDEFIVTAITEPAGKLFLIEHDKKSIWRKILDFIRNLLGFPVEKRELFIRTVDTLMDIVAESHPIYVAAFRKYFKLPINKTLYQLAMASAEELSDLANRIQKEHELTRQRINLSDFEDKVKDFVEHIRTYKAPPQMKDINIIREKFGLPFWTALQNESFKPLFDHVTKTMENKNFTLHAILQKGETYFNGLDEKRRKYVDSAIKISDALQVRFTEEHLRNFPRVISNMKIAFNLMYQLLKQEERSGLNRKQRAERRQVVLQRLNEATKLDLPKEYSQPQYVIRFKHFFDYARLPIDKLSDEEIKAYNNYAEVTQETLNHLGDTFLSLVCKLVIKNYLQKLKIDVPSTVQTQWINTLVEFGKDIEQARERVARMNPEAREIWESLLNDLEAHSLYQKYKEIQDLIKDTKFYSPRMRDPDASDMIVVVEREKFLEEYRKAYRETGNRAKALQQAYYATANANGVYLREHVRRIDPDYKRKLEHIQSVFKDSRFLVQRLPNYKLAESVWGNVSEGDLGAFLSAVAEKVRKENVDSETLMGFLEKVADTIQTELLAKSRAKQRFIKRNPYLILGYTLDNVREELFNYVNNASNYAARMVALVEGLPLLNQIDPYQQRRLRDYAHKWFFDQLKPQSQFDRIVGKVKSLMFIWYLGGVIRPALIQFTQMFISTIPMTSIVYDIPITRSISVFMKAYRDVLDHRNLDENKYLTADEKEFLRITYTSGITTAQFINQMRDEVAGRGKVLSTLATWLTTPFAYMEENNRLATALGIYRILKEKGIVRHAKDKKAMEEATTIVNMSHYLMGKLNLPIIATGGDVASGLMRLALTFRSFTLNLLESYIYMLRHLPKGQRVWGLNKEGLRFVGYSFAAFTLFGGILAIPFLDDWLQLLERLTGIPIRKRLVTVFGNPDSPLSVALERGLPAALIGMDLSGSLKIEFPRRPEDILNTIFGVYGGLSKSFADAMVALDGYDSLNILYRIMPQVFANPIRAYEAYKGIKNQYNKVILDEEGRPLRLTEGEAVLLALGIRPTRLGRTYLYKSTSRNIEKYFDSKRKAIYNAYRSAKTASERWKVYRMIYEYNMEAAKYVSIPKITLQSLKAASKPVESKLTQELKLKGY